MAKKPRKDPKQAADDAAKRSKSAPKAKTTKAKEAAPKPAAAATGPDTDKEAKALFLHHLKKVTTAVKAKDEAVNALRNIYKTAKADGYLQQDFKDAFEIQKADGEKKKKAAIARSLQVARWLGCDLSEQLDLFAQPSRVPASDRAFKEGERDAMENKAAQTEYHPSTEQYRQYMEGYHGVSERRVMEGIKKLDPEGAAEMERAAEDKAQNSAQRAKDAEAFGDGGNVVAMTRAEARAQQAAGHKAN